MIPVIACRAPKISPQISAAAIRGSFSRSPPKSMPRKQVSSVIGAAITISRIWIGIGPKLSAMSCCCGSVITAE